MFYIYYIFLLALFTIEANANEPTGTIIPLYVYPRTSNGGNAWRQLFEAQSSYPINTWAIVNVYNGPGEGVEPSFKTAIPELHSAGIKTLGYVLTDYTRRDKNLVKADIDQWKTVYNPTGIFFDEMSNEDDPSKLSYYQEMNDYAKSNGFNFTVGNPGTGVNSKYFNTVDNVVVYEKDIGFPSNDLICSQDTNGKGRLHVSILPYNIGSLNTQAVEQMKSCAGFIYVTDDGGDNPWDTLPNYLPQLFQTLKG